MFEDLLEVVEDIVVGGRGIAHYKVLRLHLGYFSISIIYGVGFGVSKTIDPNSDLTSSEAFAAFETLSHKVSGIFPLFSYMDSTWIPYAFFALSWTRINHYSLNFLVNSKNLAKFCSQATETAQIFNIFTNDTRVLD